MSIQKLTKLICGLLLGFAHFCSFAQNEWENPEAGWLKEVMPQADAFSVKQGQPPVYLAYRSNMESGAREVIGYVFSTPDLPPEELGFSGPVDMLIGMDLQGQITGVKVLFYLESYKHFRGDFIAAAEFPSQFLGKSIDQEFQVGGDIDGMSRATITSWAMARGLRNSARRVAEAYLPDSSYAVEATADSAALHALLEQSWQELIASGFVKEFTMPIEGEPDLQLAVAYMGHYRLGELLVGAGDYSNADRVASTLMEDGHMLLIGLDGNAARLQQLRLGARQNDTLFPNRKDRIVFAGTAKEGKIAGQAQYAVAMFIDSAIDISQAFTVIYDTGERSGEFEQFIGVDYQVPPAVLTLISGFPSQTEASVVDENLNDSYNPADRGVVPVTSKVFPWRDFFFVFSGLALIVSVLGWKKFKQRDKTRSTESELL